MPRGENVQISDLPKRSGSVRLPIGAPAGSRPLKPGMNENVMPGYFPCIQYGPATRRSTPFTMSKLVTPLPFPS